MGCSCSYYDLEIKEMNLNKALECDFNEDFLFNGSFKQEFMKELGGLMVNALFYETGGTQFVSHASF